jgi:hypothetical protein
VSGPSRKNSREAVSMGAGQSSIHEATLENNYAKLCTELQDKSNRINDQDEVSLLPDVGDVGGWGICEQNKSTPPLPLPQNGWTALMIACSKGYDACARELLRRGAEVDIVDKVRTKQV